MKIKAIYDNGGQTADRYTVVTTSEVVTTEEYLFRAPGMPPVYMALNLSSDCNMPNGVNMWGSVRLDPHLGKKIKFSHLPKTVQRCVKARLEE